jgi:hypothetical protein
VKYALGLIIALIIAGCGEVAKEVIADAPKPKKGPYTRYCESFDIIHVYDKASAIAWVSTYVPNIVTDNNTAEIEANRGFITFDTGTGDHEDIACIQYTELVNHGQNVKLLYDRISNRVVVYFLEDDTYLYENREYQYQGEEFEEVDNIIINQ